MIEFLRFTFESFWHFAGVVILLFLAVGLAAAIRGGPIVTINHNGDR